MTHVYNTGAYPTMITPYKKDNTVDYEAVKKYVHFYHDAGCDGIFAICQSSEIFYLSLEERVKINKTVFDCVLEIEKNGGRRMTVVSSGHISDSIEDQAKELCAVAESGTDALILITNRLDPGNEGDEVWIANAEKLMSMLPSDVSLGLYECPYPYKRLLTEKILEWCKSTGRFKFIKDTCCDSDMIKKRLEILKDSGLLLFNANCQTLLKTLRDGGAGYCGIMANYHPSLYAWLCHSFEKYPEEADRLSAFFCMSGFTENGLPYPLSAKYHMNLVGIETELITRKPEGGTVTPYVMDCMKQMKSLSEFFENLVCELK